MRLRIATFSFLVVTGVSAIAQNKQINLDQFFSALSRDQQFNGNVLVAENGKIIYEKSFGFADFSSKRLNTTKSSFPIASITKTFTATAILQLYEQAKLNVNDPIIKYLPDFPYPTITIRHLLSHTSGLQPYDKFFDTLRLVYPDTIFTNADIISRFTVVKKPLLYQPGANGNYDNINFVFLALIVEKISGIPYSDYIKKHILKRAGMNNTIIPIFSFYHYTLKEKKNLSNTYRFPYLYSDNPEKTDTIQAVAKYWYNYNFKGFGEIISTTEDLLKYDKALYNDRLLSDNILKDAYSVVCDP